MSDGKAKPPGRSVGKLPALRAFKAAMIESNTVFAQNPALGAKMAINAALEMSHQIGVYPSALIGMLEALEERECGRLPDWLTPSVGTSRLRWRERYLRSLAVAALQRLKSAGVPYAQGYAIVAKACRRGDTQVSPGMVKKWHERVDEYFSPEHVAALVEELKKLSTDDAVASLRDEFQQPI